MISAHSDIARSLREDIASCKQSRDDVQRGHYHTTTVNTHKGVLWIIGDKIEDKIVPVAICLEQDGNVLQIDDLWIEDDWVDAIVAAPNDVGPLMYPVSSVFGAVIAARADESNLKNCCQYILRCDAHAALSFAKHLNKKKSQLLKSPVLEPVRRLLMRYSIVIEKL